MSDATKREFPAERFDAVYSRETILHIEDKKALFQKILVSLLDRHLTCFIVRKLVLNINVPYFYHTFAVTYNLLCKLKLHFGIFKKAGTQSKV